MAIEKSLEETGRLQNGEERVKAIRKIYFERKKTYAAIMFLIVAFITQRNQISLSPTINVYVIFAINATMRNMIDSRKKKRSQRNL